MNVIQIGIIIVLLAALGIGGYFFMEQKKAHDHARSVLIDELLFLQYEVIPSLEQATSIHYEDNALMFLFVSTQEHVLALEASIYAPLKVQGENIGVRTQVVTPVRVESSETESTETTPDALPDCETPSEECPDWDKPEGRCPT